MIRPFTMFGYFFCLVNFAFSQVVNSSVQRQLSELHQLCLSIQSENMQLKSQLRVRDSTEYAGMRMEIFEAFNNARKINSEFLNTSDKMAVTGLFTKLLQANNPTSDILGFHFSETILKAAEKYLKSELKTEQDKNRFGQVVQKLVNNQLISTLANSNPITAVTSAIISTVAGFSTTTIQLEKEGNRIKGISAETEDAFTQKNIESFKEELKQYINFYDDLNIASAKFMDGIENINQKYTNLKVRADGYKQQLYSSLSVNDTNTLVKLAAILPDPSSRNFEYGKYLNDPRILECASFAAKLPAIEQSVRDFRREYDQTLLTFLKEYIQALQSAKKLPANSLDQDKINALIMNIESFVKSEIAREENSRKPEYSK